MKTLKNIHTLTMVQRKVAAVLMLAIALTNSSVTPVAYAADPVAQVNQTATQTEPEIVAEIPPTVQEVLLNVCQENGYSQNCAKTLLGMLWTESSNMSAVIGDGGKARGYFQIHYKLHKISIACAEDLVCSANWSIKYLERNSYPKYVNYAVQCHNSCNVNNGYSAKVVRHGNAFWNKPLAVKQAAPIVLAMK